MWQLDLGGLVAPSTCGGDEGEGRLDGLVEAYSGKGGPKVALGK